MRTPTSLVPLALAAALAGCPSSDDDTPDPFDTSETDDPRNPYADDSDYVFSWAETDDDFPYDTDGPPDTADSDDTDTDADADGVEVCEPGLVLDCLGNCFSPSSVGDGFCDNGPAPTPDFNSCDDFGRDGGDCPDDTDTDADTGDTGTPDTGDTGDTAEPLPECTGAFEVNDCQGACYPATWVGDGNCDDGRSFPYGSPDFLCAEFDQDMGDCEPDTDTTDSADTDTDTTDTADTDTDTTDSADTDTGDTGTTDTATTDTDTDTDTTDTGDTGDIATPDTGEAGPA